LKGCGENGSFCHCSYWNSTWLTGKVFFSWWLYRDILIFSFGYSIGIIISILFFQQVSNILRKNPLGLNSENFSLRSNEARLLTFSSSVQSSFDTHHSHLPLRTTRIPIPFILIFLEKITIAHIDYYFTQTIPEEPNLKKFGTYFVKSLFPSLASPELK